SALNIESIIVSGGKIGIQIELTVENLKEITEAEFADIV
ncbi:MAG: Cys-tRNA(Pro) deacylase, partial [Candidatus Bathyarchaeota archaeon]|nr:Cys-tRNA(Pro) deacylase [Candidatus Bathyarchaeota archaeon]